MANAPDIIRPPDMIKDVVDTKQHYKIVVRIVDLWYVQTPQKPGHLEMILMDSKGDKIQVSVKKDEFVQWSSNVKQNSTYVMHNFYVTRNDLTYKACDHPYRMSFTGGTTIREKHLPEIPPFEFNFKNFSDILAGNFRTDLLASVIGAVDVVLSTQPVGKKQKAAFTMKNLSGDVIGCTLWEELAIKFIRYWEKRSDPDAVIVIILTNARIKEAHEKYPVEVSNSWNGTKLLIDEDMVEINNFKASFVENQSQQPSSQRFTQMTQYSQFDDTQRFMYNAQAKSIFDINSLTKTDNMTFVTVGTTVMFIPGKHGWYYEGCSNCTKKADVENGPFTCESMHYNEKSVPRYKLETKVVDKKGSGRFVFWDNQCADIIGMSALELRNKMLEAGEDDPKVYPGPLERVLVRTLALRVRLQPTYNNLSVLKLSEKPELMKVIQEQIDSNEETSKPEFEKLQGDESVQFDTQCLSATADHDPDLISSVTPAKRGSSEIPYDEVHGEGIPSVQLSTSKMTKHIKEE